MAIINAACHMETYYIILTDFNQNIKKLMA